MNAKDYLEASKKVWIGVHIAGREKPLMFSVRDLTRPSISEIEKVCVKREDGEFVFRDYVNNLLIPKGVVGELSLYYGDECVAHRKFADIHFEDGDTLEVTWSMRISSCGKVVSVKI